MLFVSHFLSSLFSSIILFRSLYSHFSSWQNSHLVFWVSRCYQYISFSLPFVLVNASTFIPTLSFHWLHFHSTYSFIDVPIYKFNSINGFLFSNVLSEISFFIERERELFSLQRSYPTLSTSPFSVSHWDLTSFNLSNSSRSEKWCIPLHRVNGTPLLG